MTRLLKGSDKTRLHNATSFEISLKTGNAGMWSKTGTIPIGKDYVVKSTAHETYKEYWCAVQPNDDEDKVILSSDDCIEFKEIVIKPTAHDPAKFYWEGTVRRTVTIPPPPPAANPPQTAVAANPHSAGTILGFFSSLWGK